MQARQTDINVARLASSTVTKYIRLLSSVLVQPPPISRARRGLRHVTYSSACKRKPNRHRTQAECKGGSSRQVASKQASPAERQARIREKAWPSHRVGSQHMQHSNSWIWMPLSFPACPPLTGQQSCKVPARGLDTTAPCPQYRREQATSQSLRPGRADLDCYDHISPLPFTCLAIFCSGADSIGPAGLLSCVVVLCERARHPLRRGSPHQKA